MQDFTFDEISTPNMEDQAGMTDNYNPQALAWGLHSASVANRRDESSCTHTPSGKDQGLTDTPQLSAPPLQALQNSAQVSSETDREPGTLQNSAQVSSKTDEEPGTLQNSAQVSSETDGEPGTLQNSAQVSSETDEEPGTLQNSAQVSSETDGEPGTQDVKIEWMFSNQSFCARCRALRPQVQFLNMLKYNMIKNGVWKAHVPHVLKESVLPDEAIWNSLGPYLQKVFIRLAVQCQLLEQIPLDFVLKLRLKAFFICLKEFISLLPLPRNFHQMETTTIPLEPAEHIHLLCCTIEELVQLLRFLLSSKYAILFPYYFKDKVDVLERFSHKILALALQGTSGMSNHDPSLSGGDNCISSSNTSRLQKDHLPTSDVESSPSIQTATAQINEKKVLPPSALGGSAVSRLLEQWKALLTQHNNVAPNNGRCKHSSLAGGLNLETLRKKVETDPNTRRQAMKMLAECLKSSAFVSVSNFKSALLSLLAPSTDAVSTSGTNLNCASRKRSNSTNRIVPFSLKSSAKRKKYCHCSKTSLQKGSEHSYCQNITADDYSAFTMNSVATSSTSGSYSINDSCLFAGNHVSKLGNRSTLKNGTRSHVWLPCNGSMSSETTTPACSQANAASRSISMSSYEIGIDSFPPPPAAAKARVHPRCRLVTARVCSSSAVNASFQPYFAPVSTTSNICRSPPSGFQALVGSNLHSDLVSPVSCTSVVPSYTISSQKDCNKEPIDSKDFQKDICSMNESYNLKMPLSLSSLAANGVSYQSSTVLQTFIKEETPSNPSLPPSSNLSNTTNQTFIKEEKPSNPSLPTSSNLSSTTNRQLKNAKPTLFAVKSRDKIVLKWTFLDEQYSPVSKYAINFCGRKFSEGKYNTYCRIGHVDSQPLPMTLILTHIKDFANCIVSVKAIYSNGQKGEISNIVLL